ncbi:hypothetical protein DL96DRAFT_1620684 [Flagelloscypha sp. PMI_526]|nr:hypothetical protein DL96DRAFT_1620684 [Flagelloscypha sp. PMI_526]
MTEAYQSKCLQSTWTLYKEWVFESLCHHEIASGTTLTLLPMTVVEDRLHRTWGTAFLRTLEIESRQMTIYSSTSKPEATRDHSLYYVPAEVNNATFDGFLHGFDDRNTLYAFQMITEDVHPTTKLGLERLLKRAHPDAPITMIYLILPGSNFSVPRPEQRFEPEFQFYTCEMTCVTAFRFSSDTEQVAEPESDMEDEDDAMEA